MGACPSAVRLSCSSFRILFTLILVSGIRATSQFNGNDGHDDNRVLDGFDFGKFAITRKGPLTCKNGLVASEKIIGIDYNISADPLKKVNIYQQDCTTSAESYLGKNVTINGDHVVVEVNFSMTTMETTPIWIPTYNILGMLTGGNFTYCVKVNITDSASGWDMNFRESLITIAVDKTVAIGDDPDDPDNDNPSLGIIIVEVDAVVYDTEYANIDFSAEIEAFQCDTSTFTNNTVPLSMGSVLGVCAKMKSQYMQFLGWNDLMLTREGIDFIPVVNGTVPPEYQNFALVSCPVTDQCVADIQLISAFFVTDGELMISGSLDLLVTIQNSRHLVRTKVDSVIVSGKDFNRNLEEESFPGRGGFRMIVPLDLQAAHSSSNSLKTPSIVLVVTAATVLTILLQ